MTWKGWSAVGIVVLFGYGLYEGWVQSGYAVIRYPVSGTTVSGPIDVSAEPIVSPAEGKTFSMTDREGAEVSLTPVSGYSISGRVAAHETYPRIGDPCPFGELPTSATFIAFGRAADERVFSGFSADAGSGRFSVRFDDPSLASDPGIEYLQRHLSGNMFIAGNGNIDHAIRRIRVGDRIRATGTLVNVRVPSGSEFHTSVGPSDFGATLRGNAGANEILYVTELSIGSETYR